MASRVTRSFPVSVPNPEAVPVAEASLRTLARTPPHDLTTRELLAGVRTLVHRLYAGTVSQITLQDDVTVDVTFEAENGLRIELLSDGSTLTREDVEWFLELYPDSRVLLTFAGPVGEGARDLCLDHPRIDFAAVTVELTKSDSRLLDWLNANVPVDERQAVPARTA